MKISMNVATQGVCLLSSRFQPRLSIVSLQAAELLASMPSSLLLAFFYPFYPVHPLTLHSRFDCRFEVITNKVEKRRT